MVSSEQASIGYIQFNSDSTYSTGLASNFVYTFLHGAITSYMVDSDGSRGPGQVLTIMSITKNSLILREYNSDADYTDVAFTK